jgi:uncharacterized membrane protein YqgA involved in biofilm formation
VKAVVDGLSAYALARHAGWGVVLAALPVFCLQGTLTLGTLALRPWLDGLSLTPALGLTCGFLLTFVGVWVLGYSRVRLADYLPSLLWAPLLARWLG